ncbi:MAG TPA: helix-turn-helix domain-containing protein [Xanthobacteraceae bacterium]|jgi:excisionase family DNA binding protein|nr:helix-turn-helix domain-containing protein [Xanthobacteraceae bacterium]
MTESRVLTERWRARDTLTVDEAAEILRISRTSAYKLVRAGTIPSVRLGRRDIISRAAIERLLACNAAE